MVRAAARNAGPGTWTERVRRTLGRPALELGLAALILISIILIFVEASLAAQSPFHDLVATASDAITAILAGELFVRWLVSPSSSRFLSQHWLDVLAVVPLLRSLRVLRILTVLRLMRLGHLLNRRLHAHRSIIGTVAPEYILVAAIVAIVVMIASLGIHALERGVNPFFDTIEKSAWWSVYTLMASEPTGGDPVTRSGPLLAAAVMLAGLTMFAMLTGVVSASVIDRLRRRTSVNSIDLEELRNHIVIAGYNRSAAVLISELHADPRLTNTHIVIVSEGIDRRLVEELEANRDFLHFCAEDYTRLDVLKKVGVLKARMCILLADSTAQRSVQDKDARTFLAAMLIERLQPGIFTCAQLLNSENEVHLRMVGVEEVILADQYTGSILASSCRAPGIVSLVREVFSASYGHQIYRMPVPGTWIGRALLDALYRAKSAADVLIISVISMEAGKLLVNPPSTYCFAAGDELMVMALEEPSAMTGARALDRIFDQPPTG